MLCCKSCRELNLCFAHSDNFSRLDVYICIDFLELWLCLQKLKVGATVKESDYQKKIIDGMGMHVNDSVELLADKNKIIIRKPKKYDLKTLFSGYTGEKPEEFRDGPKGREEG